MEQASKTSWLLKEYLTEPMLATAEVLPDNFRTSAEVLPDKWHCRQAMTVKWR